MASSFPCSLTTVETTDCLLLRAITAGPGSIDTQRRTRRSEIRGGHCRLDTSFVFRQHHVARRWYLDERGARRINGARACWRIRFIVPMLVVPILHVAVLAAVFTRAIESYRTCFNDNENGTRMRMPSRTTSGRYDDIRHRDIRIVFCLDLDDKSVGRSDVERSGVAARHRR